MPWKDLILALGLVLVIEGILPFLKPELWRRSIIFLASHTDKSIRRFGFLIMIAGLMIIIVARHFYG